MTTNSKYWNPWADEGLTAYKVWAKDECAEDRSSNRVATSPEHAIKLWRQHYRGCDMKHIEQGPEVRTLGFPRDAGHIAWSIGKDINFERRERAWTRTAACTYRRIDWVRS